ncbi:MAG TPA: glycosyltransferase [Flavisolibacter sp.]|jgi:glycosyltransferase involved in cell wall biosynthesis|nr:glycosyltransferase [Flavisolibacter sp.]
MQRKKVLWLTSWYPNRNDRFDGDFIQRHAHAAAIDHDIHVIYVTDADLETATEEETKVSTGLTEQWIYFRRRKGLYNKLYKQVYWRKLFLEAIQKYTETNGAPDIIHVHIPWKAGLIALWLKKKKGWNFIVTEHWGIYNKVAEGHYTSQPIYVRNTIRRVVQEARLLVSVSHYLGAAINRTVVEKPFQVIPNVTDTSLFHPGKDKYDLFTFLHVSNMVPLKNVKGILEAFIALKEKGVRAQLILIGNREEHYTSFASRSGYLNQSIHFRGEVSYREVAEEMRRSHCLVLNSFIENSPCVIGEALCTGLPVIATAVGGIPELVDDSNSILIDPTHPGALSVAMESMIADYHTYETAVIAEQAKDRFGYSAVAEGFRKLYAEPEAGARS